MATVRSPLPAQRLVLQAVTWAEYTRLLKAFGERPALRMTYDRGTLEIMMTSPEHESDADLLGRFVCVLTEELDLPLKAGRCATFRRRTMKRGLEADHSWWIANEHLVRGRRPIDLEVDPPPDLAIEAEVTHKSTLNRMSIYAKLRVPEVWRITKKGLLFHVLQPNGRYVEQTHSLAFPQFTAADLMPFFNLRSQHDENEIVRRFRAFVRQRLGKP
jgi:Uma2 family endonuclease